MGRPVHLLAAAAVAALASLVSISAASAGCYSCGSSYYAAPVATYSAPVTYGYSYAAPVAYAAPAASCNCGYASYGYAASTPMYVVNQGPAYDDAVPMYAEPTPAPSYGYGYSYGYRGAYPSYAGSGYRWHRRHWGHGARNYGSRWGYRAYGHRQFGMNRYRFGAGASRMRYGMRHAMVTPGGIYRSRGQMMGHRGMERGMHRAAPGFMHQPRHAGGGMVARPHMGGAPRQMPGSVSPHQGGGQMHMMKKH